MSTAARRSRLSVARQRPAGIITDYLTVATKPNILNFLDFGLWPFTDRLRSGFSSWLRRSRTLYIYGLPCSRCTVLEAIYGTIVPLGTTIRRRRVPQL